MNHSDVVAVGVGGCCCWHSVTQFSDDSKSSEAGPGGCFHLRFLLISAYCVPVQVALGGTRSSCSLWLFRHSSHVLRDQLSWQTVVHAKGLFFHGHTRCLIGSFNGASEHRQWPSDTKVRVLWLWPHQLEHRISPFTGTLQKIIQTVTVWLCRCWETETPALETNPKFSCDEKSHYC